MKIMKKAIIFILDGAGDRSYKQLDWRTPLEFANTPNLDKIAKNGISALLYTVEPGLIPGSDTSHMALFGYEPKKCYPGRGPLEAMGENIELKPGDVAFRVNFATVDDSWNVIDRRAGRIKTGTEELASLINGLEIDGVKIIFKPSVEHRAVLVLRGEGLSDKVSDSDPHKVGVPVNIVKPLENTPEAKKTSEI
ncbi:MAG TPA: phosphoglycerate mutase, partial [Euryarchaeota archaeon]|nr:phosphoglycerate mutase [Euryarchaeota archaeon]